MNSTNDVNDEKILKRTCKDCNKIYAGTSQLYRHRREFHNEDNPRSICMIDKKDKHLFKCLEGCDLSFRCNVHLRDHLNSFHKFNIKEKVIRFRSKEGFDMWFNDVKEAGAHYVKHHGVKKCNKGYDITYFKCNRSGKRRTMVTDRKRKEKKYGSRKINAGCTSVMKLIEYHNRCVVTYCDFHYGHKIELEHVPVPLRARADIINELERGARIVRVNLQDGFDHIELNNLQRSRILTRADLLNLRKNTKKNLKIPPIEVIENINDIEIGPSPVISISNENAKSIGQNGELLGTKNEVEERIEIQMEVEVEDYINEEAMGDNDENTLEESKEEAYGRYVVEKLREMKPLQRESAKTQINDILNLYLIM